MSKIKKEKIGVIGLGYVGKPLAYLASKKGYDVVGIDVNEVVIDKINKRKDIPPQIKNYTNKSKLFATNDFSKLKECEIIIVCVPTPTKNSVPDISILENVSNKLKEFLCPNCLLIIESTVAPGMTRKCFENILLKEANLKLEEDYELAYCPERIDPGNDKYWLGNINRVCGASSKIALKRAINFYESIIKAKIYKMKSIEEAELVKVWENSMRNISIAEVNLLAKICDYYNFEIDDILKGLKTKIEQFKPKLSYPGIGPGGHCIPEDIKYLIQDTEKITDVGLLKNSVKINESMPDYIFKKLKEQVAKNNEDLNDFKLLILGKSYKQNTLDTRCSPALKLYEIIKNGNYNVEIWDPLIDEKEEKIQIVKEKINNKISNANIVILGCPHDLLINQDYTKYKNIKYLVDCWNKLDKEKIIKNQIEYIGVGR